MSNNNRIRWLLRLAASAAVCAFLTACATQGGGGAFYPGTPIQGKAVYGLERGSRSEALITGNDREAIAVAAGDLLSSGQVGAVRTWAGGSGNAGQLRLGSTYLIGLDATSGAPVLAPPGIDTGAALAPMGGNFVTEKNANVRLGPSPTATVSQTLAAGTAVRGYGYDRSGDWYLVGTSEEVLGYISGLLLKSVGGGAPVLAGGAPRRPRLCRNIDLSMTISGASTDSWSSIACRSDMGWQVPSERGLM